MSYEVETKKKEQCCCSGDDCFLSEIKMLLHRPNEVMLIQFNVIAAQWV